MALHMGVSARPGAVFDGANRGLAAVELARAVSASRGATCVANSPRPGPRHVVATALPARNDRNNGDRPKSYQFGVFVPKRLFGDWVANRAEGQQVFKFVSFAVIREQVERAHMVNRHPCRNDAAHLACVGVALSRGAGLPLPVRPPVGRVPAHPSGVIVAAPLVGGTPRIEARATAEVAGLNRVRLLLDGNAACVAGDRNALTTDANAVSLLPFAVTGEPAKVSLRF